MYANLLTSLADPSWVINIQKKEQKIDLLQHISKLYLHFLYYTATECSNINFTLQIVQKNELSRKAIALLLGNS